MSQYERLRQPIQRLSLADKQALHAWLVQEIENEGGPPKIQPKKGREVIETTKEGQITYQSELIRCGKATCKCVKANELHGPYWYGYRRKDGKLKSWYIGKELKRQHQDEGE